MNKLLFTLIVLTTTLTSAWAQCFTSFMYYESDPSTNEITFVDSTYGTTPNAFSVWDFGDGTVDSSYGLQGAVHSYNAPGLYVACLVVTYNGTSCGTYCDTVLVRGTSSTCGAGFQYTLSNNSASFSSSVTGTAPFAYSWDFGDNSTGTSANPVHTYNTNGNYNACLTITDATGCTSTFCDAVTIGSGNGNCSASFTSTATATGLTQFTSSLSNPAGAPYTYAWDFGDGGTGTTANPAHTYTSSGTFVACLTVTSTSGCTDTYCDSVFVPSAPTSFDVSGSVFAGNTPASAVVYLIVEDSLALYLIDSTVTQQGYYQFRGVTQGNYLIKAALTPNATNYTDYLPTYYGNELLWSNAASIFVNQTLTGQNIDLIAGNNPGGPGFVGGLISQGANKQGEGDPEVGVHIMLLDMNNDPVQYTYSNAQGEWEFSNVAYGTYQVYAEIAGKTTEPVTITIDATHEMINNIGLVVESLRVTGSEITSGIEEILMSTSHLYPNPTTGVASLTISTERSTNAEMVVLNAMGQEVMREELILNAGQQELKFNINNNPTGIYFMQLRIEGQSVLNEKILKQ